MRNVSGLAIAVALAVAESALAQSVSVSEATVSAVRVYTTARHGELQSTLPLPTRIQTPKGSQFQEHYQVIFSISVEGVAERDVLTVMAEMEATNDCGYDVALGTWLMIGVDANRTVPDPGRGEAYLSYPAGFNVTNGNYQLPGAGDRSFMHHGFVARSAIFVVPKGTSGRRHVNLIAYAQSDKLDCKRGNGLKVEVGNGKMSVQHLVVK